MNDEREEQLERELGVRVQCTTCGGRGEGTYSHRVCCGRRGPGGECCEEHEYDDREEECGACEGTGEVIGGAA